MDHAYQIHCRRRIGAKMWARKTSRRASTVFLGSIGCLEHNSHVVGRRLPPEVCRMIAAFVESEWNACEHNWRPCLRCRRCRCSLCGARFFSRGSDPRACQCVLGSRKSMRLVERRQHTWLSDSGFPHIRPLHAEFPQLYPDSD